jgi:hydrogenase maturation protease
MKTRILVCGNADRRDDGAAIDAADSLLPGLAKDQRERIEVVRCGQLEIEDLLDAPAGMPLLIVDAAVGVPSGSIVRRTFDELVTDAGGPAPHSSHSLPIAQVVGVARQLSDAPLNGLFIGIGAADYGFGTGLSDPVRRRLPEFVAAVGTAIAELS